MKLILFPLIFLVIFAFLGQMGMSSTVWNATSTYSNFGEPDGWYDENGHQVCDADGTPTGESGHKEEYYLGGFLEDIYDTIYSWVNATDAYPIYDTSDGFTQENENDNFSFNLASSLGIIGIIIAAMALAAIVGIRVLGSGVNTFSVSTIVLGTVFLALWGIFSYLAISMITAASLLGVFFYMFLTILYMLGVVQQFSGSGED